jgi:hypothetical protein
MEYTGNLLSNALVRQISNCLNKLKKILSIIAPQDCNFLDYELHIN